MRFILGILAGMLLVAPAYAGDVKSEVIEQNEAFDKAYADHDFKKLGEFYLEDAIVYPQYSDVLKGRDAIQALWQSYEKDMTAVDYETIEVLNSGDLAVVFGKYDATYQGKPDQGRYMTVWKKDSGVWKIARDTWYSNPSQ